MGILSKGVVRGYQVEGTCSCYVMTIFFLL